MTTPAASGTLYASTADLRNVLNGTDSGTGTASQLTEQQLTLALYAASNRVSVYVGSVYDSSTPQAVPPPILHDLTLDLAAFWATKTYLKHKVIANDHPVYLAYQNAQQILNDVRDGKLRLDPASAGSDGVGREMAKVINRIPQVFTGEDSNTRLGMNGVLEPDVPLGEWAPLGLGWEGSGGAVYQG
jgi:phage gp36-like protein